MSTTDHVTPHSPTNDWQQWSNTYYTPPKKNSSITYIYCVVKGIDSLSLVRPHRLGNFFQVRQHQKQTSSSDQKPRGYLTSVNIFRALDLFCNTIVYFLKIFVLWQSTCCLSPEWSCDHDVWRHMVGSCVQGFGLIGGTWKLRKNMGFVTERK